MPRSIIANPWQIDGSDSEEEINNQYNLNTSFSSKPSVPIALSRRSEPKILDWHPIVNENKPKGKLGGKKTVPLLEKATSFHKPLFSGLLNRRSSLSSSRSILRSKGQNKMLVPLTAMPSFDPILCVEEDSKKFIYTYIPPDYSTFIHCYLRRDKSSIQKEFFPTYYLHMERPDDDKKIFLLAARKVPKVNQQSQYIITTQIETLHEKSGGDGYVGRLQETNMKGTEYTLYDDGMSPSKYKKSHSNDKNGLRRELISIIYSTNILGFKGPRQINAVIPQIDYDIRPTKDEDTILDQWRDRRFTYLIQLRNRTPQRIDGRKGHVLEFDSHHNIQASVKNFQMVVDNENLEEEVVMQFGRITDDTFLLDYRYPLSAIQAFSIALSAFDSHFTRE
ncbi:unnamed protein product [Rotaria sp. Silwood1]|nr:unnamed protein product [Rotaria sp. Silwood1]CAF3739561.1 unnamed protein product [Rotaria sp. Silwood1]CAF4734361.1 unnamed protein product [Rotaria sp. Silwood1]CAF4777352.1 unnamed protein product [Rotaria sp. Silwood1]